MTKFWSKLSNFKLFNGKKALLGFIFLLLLSFFLPKMASAGLLEDLVERILSYLVTLLPRLLFALYGILIYLTLRIYITFLLGVEALLKWVIAGPTDWAYTQPGRNPVIDTGLQITLPLVNMFFILIFVVIAFATILRIQSYGLKKLLPVFIVVAILVNFAPVVLGLVVDFGNLLMNFFFFNTSDASFGIFSTIAKEIFKPDLFWYCIKALFAPDPNPKVNENAALCLEKKVPTKCQDACQERQFSHFSCRPLGIGCKVGELHAEEGVCRTGEICCCREFERCDQACQARGFKDGACLSERPENHEKIAPWDTYLPEGPCEGAGGPYCYCWKYQNCTEACQAKGYSEATCSGLTPGRPDACGEDWTYLKAGPCTGIRRNCCCKSPTSGLEKFFGQKPGVLEILKRTPASPAFAQAILEEETAKEELNPHTKDFGVGVKSPSTKEDLKEGENLKEIKNPEEENPVRNEISNREKPAFQEVLGKEKEAGGITQDLQNLLVIFLTMIGKGWGALIFTLVTFIVLLVYSLLFLVRYLMIWILVILAPIAFACFILPKTKGFFDWWLKQFSSWVFIGIMAALFVYLGAMIAKTSSEMYKFLPSQKVEVYQPLPGTEMDKLLLEIKKWADEMVKWLNNGIEFLNNAKLWLNLVAALVRPFPLIGGAIGSALADLVRAIDDPLLVYLSKIQNDFITWRQKIESSEDLPRFAQDLKTNGAILKSIGKPLRDVMNMILNFPVIGQILGSVPVLGDILRGARDFGQMLVDIGQKMIEFANSLEKYVLAETLIPGQDESWIKDLLDKFVLYLPAPLFMGLGLYFVLKSSGIMATVVAAAAARVGMKVGLGTARMGKAAVKRGGKAVGRRVERTARLPERARAIGEKAERVPVIGGAVAAPFRRYGARIGADIKRGEEYSKKLARPEAARALLLNRLRSPYANLGLLAGGRLDYTALSKEAERMGHKGKNVQLAVQRAIKPTLDLGKKVAPEKVNEILKTEPRFARLPELRKPGETGQAAIERVSKGMKTEDWKNVSPEAFKEDRALSDAFLKHGDIKAYKEMPAKSREAIQEEIQKRGKGGLAGTKLAEYIKSEKMAAELEKAGWRLPKIEGGAPPTAEELEKGTTFVPIEETKPRKILEKGKKVGRAATLGTLILGTSPIGPAVAGLAGTYVAGKYAAKGAKQVVRKIGKTEVGKEAKRRFRSLGEGLRGIPAEAKKRVKTLGEGLRRRV